MTDMARFREVLAEILEDRNHERRLRRRAARQGLSLHKLRGSYGDYFIADPNTNIIEVGGTVPLNLDEVEHYLTQQDQDHD